MYELCALFALAPLVSCETCELDVSNDMNGVSELVWSLAPAVVTDNREPQRPEPSSLRPHMEKRGHESTAQFRARLAWSCYWCGKRFARTRDETARALAREALRQHEDAAPRGCKIPPGRGDHADA